MDRNEAIKLLKDTNLFLRCSLAGDIRIVQAMNMAIAALEKAETNCSEIPDNWIPCSERWKLPKVGIDVLITKEPLKIKGYEQEVIIAKRLVDPRSGKIEWWSAFGALKDKSVLAWMSKPSPWKGETGGQTD